MQVTPNDRVPQGRAFMSEDLQFNCPFNNCRNRVMRINNTNLYYEIENEFTISSIYNRYNFNSLTGLRGFNEQNGRLFINTEDYNNLFDQRPYQSSIFVSNVRHINDTATQLEEMGIIPLVIKDTIFNHGAEQEALIRIAQTVVIIVLLFVMFFVSYFIIKLILKSRNIYFSTLRILGASKKTAKKLLDIELFTTYNIAFLIMMTFIYLVHIDIINFNYAKTLSSYITILDYVIVYVILLIMTQLISNTFAKSLFKKSAMNTYREEV